MDRRRKRRKTERDIDRKRHKTERGIDIHRVKERDRHRQKER
jgi:hypothetical protein